MAFVKERIIKHTLGRPTKYRPEYAAQLIEFFETAATPEYDTKENGERVLVREGFFPTLARFATYCGVLQQTLRNWADAKDIDGSPLYPEFFTAYYTAQNYQEAEMAEGYMSGRWTNASFGALIAKNLLAWKDKQEIESKVEANVQSNVTQKIEIDFSDIVAEAKQTDE